MAENKNFDIQQLAAVYQELDAQLQAINEQITYIDNFQMGISITKKTVEEIRKTGADQELILPIGNAAYIKAKIVDPDNFLVSIGKDVLVEKNAEEALAYARKLEEEQSKAQTVLQNRMNQLNAEMEKIRPILEQYIQLQENSQQ